MTEAADRYRDTVGRAVIETVHAYGVDVVFGIPGTHNLELYRPLADLGIRAVTTRHEQGAGYGSDGWSQQRGLPGVVIATSGPGLQNTMSAVGTAWCESRPMLVLSPGMPLEPAAATGILHETKNASAAMQEVAHWSRRVRSGAEAVEAVHEAFELFGTQRPRPVHVEIPLDLLESPAEVSPRARRARPLPPPAAAGEREIDSAARILAAATRPVVVAGGGATRAGEQVRRLAELLGAPVVTTLNGKATVPETHPLAVGSELRLQAVRELCEEADALVVLGSKLGEAELWAPRLEARGRVVRVDVDPARLHTNLRADVELVGDCATVLDQLLAALSARVPANRPEPELEGLRQRARAEAREAFPAVMALAERLAAAVPEDAIVAGDSSQVVYLGLGSTLRQSRPHSLLYTPTYATLGYGVPAAIGAAVAGTGRPVVAVVGDGALMFCVNELMTAVEQRLDLTVVCVDNGGYGEIRQNEVERGIAPIGVELAQPDWVALANAFGAHGRRVSDDGHDLESCVRDAVAAGGVQLVHVPPSVTG